MNLSTLKAKLGVASTSTLEQTAPLTPIPADLLSKVSGAGGGFVNVAWSKRM